MTLEEFYTKKSNLKAPEGLDFLQRRNWYITEKQKLQEQLSSDDLKIVLENQKEWQNKVDSSIL